MKTSLLLAVVGLCASSQLIAAEPEFVPVPVPAPAPVAPPAVAAEVDADAAADAEVEAEAEADEVKPAPAEERPAPPAAIAAPAAKVTAADADEDEDEDDEDAPKPAPVPKAAVAGKAEAEPAASAFPDRSPVFEDVSSVTRNYIDPDLIADAPNPITFFGDGFWEPGRVSAGRFTPTLILYGDLRTVYAAFENPDSGSASDVKTLQTKLNLQFDLKLTATERIHASFEPLTNNGENTRIDYDPTYDREFEHSLKPVTLFFEGELDSIFENFGGSAQHDTNDLNYALALGLFPFELHNGYLLSDIFVGVGVTKNNISVPWASNFGVGVVWAASDVSATQALDVDDNSFQMVTLHSFADLAHVRTEASVSWLGSTDDDDVAADEATDIFYAGASFSWLRGPVGQGLHVFGQAAGEDTGLGGLATYESNYRLTPIVVDGGTYVMLNGFYGTENWRAISGNLNQIGTTFQSDGITNFSSQQNNGEDSAGGALAIQHKTLNRRLHFIPEVSYVDDYSQLDNDTTAMGLRVNYGFGRRSVLRMDLRRFFPTIGDPNNAGRVEYQVKF